ncbi:MAG: HAMP domain-containing sensor histidine kinase [Candidatus Metalachnospira sp.]|nr:HAMP domain-containing sensor histidine kinase [Candidatus Metalachnospira sp.]
MNTKDLIFLVIAVTAVVSAIIAVILYRRNMKRTLKSMNSMLDSAIDGSFSEAFYDESLLSAVEAKLAHYLASSEVSAKNLTAEKDKIKELLSDISHQTKTPIANILLYSELLAEQELSEKSGECVVALKTQAEKLNFLIGALVKTSRIETGVFVLNPKKEKIQPLLDSVCKEISAKAGSKNIKLIIEKTNIQACFDLKWTTEALYNIVDNAVKYTPYGREIRIQTSEYNLFCRIDVKDNGIGIDEGEQADIFRRFYRSKRVSQTDGLGIGLYLSREIISEQGGYIKVTSEFGNGATFSIFLPRPQ